MNILYLALDFPVIGKGSNLYSDLMEELRDQGHEIYVVASSVETGKTGMFKESGLNIIRVRGNEHQNVSLFKKGKANLELPYKYIAAIQKNLKNIHLDFMILPTPPITLSVVAKKLKKERNLPMYLILRDIFPQNAVDLGMMRKGLPVHTLFRRMEKKLYKLADTVGCMSPANIEFVIKYNKVDESKLHILRNWQKEEIFSESTEADLLKAKYQLDNKFVILFGGNISKPQCVENIVNFAKECESQKEVVFFIVGKGTEKFKLETLVEKNNLGNVILEDFLPRSEYMELLKLADAGLISLDERFTIPNFPSKSISYFNAKIPVLALLDAATDFGTWVEDEVKAGYWSLASDTESLAEKVKYLKSNPQVANTLGENGYNYFVEYLNPKLASKTILDEIGPYV